MAYDTTTQVTDDLSDNLASYHNQLKTAADHLMSSTAYAAYTRTQSMTGNVTLTDSDFPIQSFSPTAARDLTLPTVASTNHAFYVVNRSATYAITIKNSGGTTITTVPISSSTMVYSDGANGWYYVGSSTTVLANAEGVMKNGTLSVTVASNNLTVALKTLAGTNPSSSDPVKIVIAGTERTVSSALSVTKNAGTNWCNSGGSELATKEVDYFVYLGYNATDGVVIGFSRIPYANRYGDFSATSTNETYCGISTITNAASTDYYSVIGRFAATLSAGAGYTWTVPTYTALNLINRPIFHTRWSSFAPQYGGFSSAPTDTSVYKVVDDICFIHRDVSTNGTSNATTFTMTFPFQFANPAAIANWVATTDNGATSSTPGHMQIASAGSNSASMYKTFYQGIWTGSGTKNVYLLDFNYKLR